MFPIGNGTFHVAYLSRNQVEPFVAPVLGEAIQDFRSDVTRRDAVDSAVTLVNQPQKQAAVCSLLEMVPFMSLILA
jgi:hypothetical protein